MSFENPLTPVAIAIKTIPTLESKTAESFVKKAEATVKARGTVNFSQQVKSAHNILAKSKLK